MTAAQRIDSWPRTRRPLPWLFAVFLAAIFLVPVDAIQLKAHLPFSPDLDRFLVTVILVVWAAGALLRGHRDRLRLRPRGWALPTLVFFAICVIGIVLNIGRITNLGELAVAEKRLALLIAMIAVFAVFAVSLRVTELRSFAALIVVLASLTSLGTIYEQKTGENLFYSTASTVFSPVATVEPAPTEESPGTGTGSGRPLISGPTRHALSVASLLGMSLPFAVVFAAMSADRKRRLLWGLLACLILAGALVTQRRSGVIVPAVAMLAIFAIRPRKMLSLLPYAAVAVLVGLFLAGGTISVVHQIRSGSDQASNEGRTSDYAAVVPDLLTHPAIGRGYGTLNSIKVDTYRILDNQYLGIAYQMGLLGLLAFAAMILAPPFVARHVVRSDNPLRGPPALTAAAGCLAFAVAAALYDILSFPQAPYLFFFLAAMCTCVASVERVAPRPTAARRSSPRGERRGARPARPAVEPA